ncbi:hypothetical protein EJB05_45295, partial [Eragrostis curvula]
ASLLFSNKPLEDPPSLTVSLVREAANNNKSVVPPSHVPIPSSPRPGFTIFPPFPASVLPPLSTQSAPGEPKTGPRAPAAMRWDAPDAEVALERILDLHDRLSDAILAASRACLLLPPPPPPAPSAGAQSGGGGRNGCVFVKGEGDGAAEAVAEARSLHAIRSALEDLEDHLEFLHTVQSQQRAERDAAIARLEQSRLVLAMRLSEHQGKQYRVIDEALEFLGDVSDKSRFISPEDVRATHSRSEDNAEESMGNGSRIMANVLSCSLSLAKNSFRLDKIGGALGNAAVFAVSMLAFLQLHQTALGSKTPAIEYGKRTEDSFQSGTWQKNGKGKHIESQKVMLLDVLERCVQGVSLLCFAFLVLSYVKRLE